MASHRENDYHAAEIQKASHCLHWSDEEKHLLADFEMAPNEPC